MVYKQANQILGSLLSPNNRGICKKTALDSNAQEGPLTGFASNRLVPVSAVVKKYYVVFVNEGGTVISSGYYEPGAALNDPGVPSKTGHTGAWNNGYTGYATGDATYSPVYTPISYTITYQYEDGTTYTTQSVPYGSTPTHPAVPPKTGYTGSWPAAQVVTGPQTYRVQYTANSYLIRYYDSSAYGSTLLKQEYVSYGGTTTPPSDPGHSGYALTGWSPSFSSTVTGAQDYTAVYTSTGPSTAGPFMIQGGCASSLPWNYHIDGNGDYDANDGDITPEGFDLYRELNTASVSGTLTVTGYKYNCKTKQRTELPSGCYITFQNVQRTASNTSNPPMVFTLSDALYDQGWRLYRGDMTYANSYYQEPSTDWQAGWHGEQVKTKAYATTNNVYVASGHGNGRPGLIGCRAETPEIIWVFYLSTSDATLSTSGTTHYPTIADSCYGDEQTYQADGSTYNDSNIPAIYTGAYIR